MKKYLNEATHIDRQTDTHTYTHTYENGVSVRIRPAHKQEQNPHLKHVG